MVLVAVSTGDCDYESSICSSPFKGTLGLWDVDLVKNHGSSEANSKNSSAHATPLLLFQRLPVLTYRDSTKLLAYHSQNML